jgi:hypothetical protein
MDQDFSEFDLDWSASRAENSAPLFPAGDSSVDDWEKRYSEHTTGFVPDPLTTSFTDLDLRPALPSAVAPKWHDSAWSVSGWPESDNWTQ